ncbi:MAG: hypothetical protein ABJJ37_25105 [Roseibium sp.]
MIRLLVLLTALLFSLPSWAQEAPVPLIKTSLEKDTAIPGQPLIFRITILVPTWMPKPPVFPSFEARNVIVRLPSRASGPASERVNGQTWSGVTRAYRFYPMVPGKFQIPSGTVHLTYADPETRKPVEVDVDTDAFSIFGKAPAGAENLQPFLAANSVTLERKVEGTPEQLEAGDALTLTTTARISGVSPMFIPPFGETSGIEGLSIYPKAPVVEEKDDRGKLSGHRTETVTIVAEFAGEYQIPETSLSWYNLDSGKVETVSVPPVAINVTGLAPTVETSEPIDWRSVLINAAGLLALLAITIKIARWISPKIVTFVQEQRTRYRASETFAYRKMTEAIKNQDVNAFSQATIVWQTRINHMDPDLDWSSFEAASLDLGREYFDDRNETVSVVRNTGWHEMRSTLRTIRKTARANRSSSQKRPLPALNPSV